MFTQIDPRFDFARRRGLGFIDDFTIDAGDWFYEVPGDIGGMFEFPVDVIQEASAVPVTTSPMIEGPGTSFDWSGTLSKIADVGAKLAPTVAGIIRSVNEGDRPSSALTPPGYYRDPVTGQLKPLSGGGGTNWLMLGAIGLGAYFLMKK